MSETWYKASCCLIAPVEIEKETDKQVVRVGGSKSNKTSDWFWYAKTFEEAKRMMVEQYQADFDKQRKILGRMAERLKIAKQLKK